MSAGWRCSPAHVASSRAALSVADRRRQIIINECLMLDFCWTVSVFQPRLVTFLLFCLLLLKALFAPNPDKKPTASPGALLRDGFINTSVTEVEVTKGKIRLLLLVC